MTPAAIIAALVTATILSFLEEDTFYTFHSLGEVFEACLEGKHLFDEFVRIDHATPVTHP